MGQSKLADAEALLIKSWSALRDNAGVPAARRREALARFVSLYDSWGKTAEADKWRGALEISDKAKK